MIERVTRPQAKKIGENDTWSNSLMSHKAQCQKDAGPFSLAFLPIEEADLNEKFGLVA
jgi:hypothetical protein